jgi:glycosyltransferase involved in cell wall biosynthesis
MPEFQKDIFICHASEDKDEVVQPLVAAFDREEISYWLDEAEIRAGDSITAKVGDGLRKSRYVLVVLSRAFVDKHFAQAELGAALFEQASTGEVKVIPLLVGPEYIKAEILGRFPLLRDRSHIVWKGDPSDVIDALFRRLRPDGKTVGNVCFISSEYPPHVVGGLGVHVDQLSQALAAHVDVDVILPTLKATEYQRIAARVRPYAVANSYPSYDDPVSWLRFSEIAALKVQVLADFARPDVIHCHDWVTVLAGINCGWRFNIPVLFHLHLPNRSPLCASVENLGLVCADLVTVNSEAMHVELMDRGLPIRRVEVVNNGYDRDLFHPCNDWPADDGYVLFVGRLVEQKGVEYLLRALYFVREKFPDVGLKIVGSGPFGPLLERLCTNLTLSNKVEFLGWRQGRELAALYQKARLVVIPSIYEPFGMTALEALACRRPVVASRVGGLKEIIRHGVTGLLAEPKDYLDLAQQMMTLLSQPDLRSRLGEAGQQYISEGEAYTWSGIARQFLKLYRSLPTKGLQRKIPGEASEFRRQIFEVAREISPEFRASAHERFGRLFEWMG